MVSRKSGWAWADDAKHAELSRYDETGNYTVGTKVRSVKLDEIMVPKCNLIKIDVEGHGLGVIDAGQRFINNQRLTLYTKAQKEIPETRTYLKWLFENNLTCHWHFATWLRTGNYRTNSESIAPSEGDMNTLAQLKEKPQPKILFTLTSYKEDLSSEELIRFSESSRNLYI